MLSRIKFEIEPLVSELLDQLPAEVWTSKTTTFFDPAIGGGQFVREIEHRLRKAGHSNENISGRVQGCESSKLNVQYVLNKYKLVGKYFVSDFLNKDFRNMKFDVVVGNPPFSKRGEGKQAGKRGEELYIKFYKLSTELAPIVAMIMPSTDDKLQKQHNEFLKKTANIITHIDEKVFKDINMPMWYVISDSSNSAKASNISWKIGTDAKNPIKWIKGKVNVTTHGKVSSPIYGKGIYGSETQNSPDDIELFHKVNETHGVVKYWVNSSLISEKALFPKTGYAVLMPQTFSDSGWSKVEVIECNGRQAAFNGVNIVFVNTLAEATKLVSFMKTKEFLSEGIRVRQGFNNMTISCLSSMELVYE